MHAQGGSLIRAFPASLTNMYRQRDVIPSYNYYAMVFIRFKHPMSFRIFLAAAALVILLPTQIAIGILVWYDFCARRDAVENELLTITRMVAAAVNADMQRWLSDLQRLKSTVASEPAVLPQLERLLRAHLDRHPETRALAVTDAEGVIVAQSGGLNPPGIAQLLHEIPQTTGALEARAALSSVRADPTDGTPLIWIAIAAGDGSPSVASVMALQRLDDISLILAEENKTLGWQTAIVDQDGRAVTASDPALRDKLFIPPLPPEPAATPALVRRARMDDLDRYFAVVQAAVAPWRVVSRVPTDVLDTPSRYEIFSVLMLGGLLTLPVAVSVLLGRYLGRRPEALANAAHTVATGVMPHAMQPTGLREVDVVQRALRFAGVAVREQAETRERMQDMKETLELAQRMEGVGQVMAGVAHDFGNLIFTIRGNLELLRRSVGEQSSEQGFIGPSLLMADEAAKLVSQLSAGARQKRRQAKLVNLNADLTEIHDLLCQVAGRSVTLTMQLERNLMDCRLDPTLLRSTLLNLVVNARKAMPRGGEIRIASWNAFLDDSTVAANGLAAGPYVAVSVQDTGGGIHPEVRTRIFEPFFTTDLNDGGSGFGLSILYGFVKANGGLVSVDSVVGRGTTFTLHFPAEPGRADVPLSNNDTLDFDCS